MSEAIIQVDDVSKSYGGVKANVDISLQVKRGSITGIIGPNGCGKTTLFNSIVGYHPIDKGSIKFDGKEISHLLVGDIARLGMLRTFQQTRIYSKMNCVDNMQISVSHRAESKSSMFANRKGEIRDRAEHLLEFVGLYSKRNLISGDLSFWSAKAAGIRHGTYERTEGAATRRADSRYQPDTDQRPDRQTAAGKRGTRNHPVRDRA